MVVHVARNNEPNEEALKRFQRRNTEVAKLTVVIYVNASDESGSQSAAVAKIVDEIQRRVSDVPLPACVLSAGDLRMDRDRHEVTRAGKHIHLSPMEYALLEHLLLHRDRVQTESRLMASVFGESPSSGCFNTLWVHMHRLRKKIDGRDALALVHTIRGVGYILKTPLQPHTESLPG